MVTRRWALPWVSFSLSLAGLFSATLAMADDASIARITILYDAFGKAPAMEKDWGYSAFVEYSGKRILFDTGNNPEILAKNARSKGIDLARLDFVILSHRHGDHMGGLDYLLRVNPNVKIYAPKENFGVYGSSLPSTFYRTDESLTPEQRYYGGSPPAVMKFGSAWPHAHFDLVENNTEIAPGIHLISLVSDKAGTLELRELSLAIQTPDGLILVVGCSHPGIEKIVQAAASIDSHIHLVIGGLHLVTAKDPDIDAMVRTLHDTWKVDYVAPGHCTGEPAFAALKKAYGNRYLYAGLGTVLKSGATPVVTQSKPRAAAVFAVSLAEFRIERPPLIANAHPLEGNQNQKQQKKARLIRVNNQSGNDERAENIDRVLNSRIQPMSHEFVRPRPDSE
jgi:7,8-dihydropterin-6-yl-methyl-4-(beta-D-ribofuranosyl)aminobenzene 5'-phosphate synthase